MMRAFVAMLALAAASPAPAPVPVEAIDGVALRAHIDALSDDVMEGRGSGTRGGDRAVDYIQGQMEKAGLAPGAADGGWWQQVDLVERKPVSGTLGWQGRDGGGGAAAGDFVALGDDSEKRIGRASVVYAGYGLAPGGSDVRGAIVLLLPGKPQGMAATPPLEARRVALARRGALAVVVIAPGEADWPATRARNLTGRTVLASERIAPVEAVLSAAGWASLATAAGSDPATLAKAAEGPGFVPRRLRLWATIEARTDVRRYAARNVIGRIAGATRPREAVFVTAHWDHLGLCRPQGAADRICNGAIDNASGVAQLIEIGRTIAAGQKPGRSVYFVATTAEELGLLGARALVRSPPIPLRRIKAALNLDMTALAPTGQAVSVVGRGLTPLDPIVDETARRLGRSVDGTDALNIYAARQDGWEFLKRGVPAVMAGGSFTDTKRLEAFFGGHYHNPADENGDVETGGAIEDGAFHVALVRALADPARFPMPAP